MEITKEIIDKAKLEAGTRELHQVDIDLADGEYSLLLAAPSRVEWMKFLSDLTSTDDVVKKNQAHENFVLACAKYPERAQIQEFIGKKFGVLTELTDQLGAIVGAGAKVRSKKL